MKKILLLLTTAVLLVGCESDDKDKFSRQIYIDSAPAGTPIVVDGLRLGKTPLSIGVETNENGCFVRKTVITAIPSDSAMHTQIVSFPPYRIDDDGKSEVPETIFFDMSKSPAQGGGVKINDGE